MVYMIIFYCGTAGPKNPECFLKKEQKIEYSGRPSNELDATDLAEIFRQYS